MKNAKLWKRILREGVDGPAGEVINAIITAPIITDGLSPDHYDGPMSWMQYQRMGIPFERFWIDLQETPDGTLVGGMFDVHKTSDGHSCQVLVVNCGRGTKPCTAGVAYFQLDTDGSLALERDGTFRCECVLSPSLSPSDKSLVEYGITVMLSNCFDLLLMLGCQNVSLESRFNDPELVRRATRRHGVSATGYRYHVLVVTPAGSKPGTPGQEIGNMPRHVCRGHFAEYGPKYGKGKLFGKYEGRFFIPPHVKGKAESGIVDKDYEVRP